MTKIPHVKLEQVVFLSYAYVVSLAYNARSSLYLAGTLVSRITQNSVNVIRLSFVSADGIDLGPKN